MSGGGGGVFHFHFESIFGPEKKDSTLDFMFHLRKIIIGVNQS